MIENIFKSSNKHRILTKISKKVDFMTNLESPSLDFINFFYKLGDSAMDPFVRYLVIELFGDLATDSVRIS